MAMVRWECPGFTDVQPQACPGFQFPVPGGAAGARAQGLCCADWQRMLAKLCPAQGQEAGGHASCRCASPTSTDVHLPPATPAGTFKGV